MRLLVLGGTVFVGWHVAAEALRRGHDVTCAARGVSGSVPAGARLVRVDRDDPDGLAALSGQDFDAVVDVATVSYPWVKHALRTLGDRVGHWTFVSTISVYADKETPGQTTDGPLLPPLLGQGARDVTSPDDYGSIKVASENAVRDALGDRAFVVRAGLIGGPGDTHDRFGYWPARLSQPERNGGRVVVPDVPEQPVQFIDVRDLAIWILDAGEGGRTGTYDGVYPARPLPELLAAINELVGGGAELVPVAPSVLDAAGVTPWAGPRSLPLWLPPAYHGFQSRDVTASLAAGLPVRPLAEMVSAALEHERSLGLDRPRAAGLTPRDEADILAAAG